ncbi:GNAT family N-acetyltransferase [Nocardioides sp.]|uniref:GNAT family N-acetyltransferase n=1 Tax=Nocardioides sp. TaxID=35761 RepID=UPI00351379F9
MSGPGGDDAALAAELDVAGATGWPVRTPRLRLRPAVAADAEPTFALRSDPEVARWLTSQVGDPAAYRERFVAKLGSTVVVEHEGRVVMDLMVSIADAWAQAEVREQALACEAELGWTLDPAHAGRGLATEAVRALLDLCFASRAEGGLGLRRVIAVCFADNTASWRLMERLGMRREGHAVADALHRDGTWRDTLTYALLASEHPAGPSLS